MTQNTLQYKTFAQFDLPQMAKTALASVLDTPFLGIQTDTRCLNDGDIFVLLAPFASKHDAITDTQFRLMLQYTNFAQKKSPIIITNASSVFQHFAKAAITKSVNTIDIDGCILVYDAMILRYLGCIIYHDLRINNPVFDPDVVAVTGTNGKTTISQLCAQLFTNAGKTAAVMGTAGNGILPNLQKSTHTTLQVQSFHTLLHQFASQGVGTVCIEASSHGLDQYRLSGAPIKTAIFSNLSHDHLDYHADMDDYAHTKMRLFDIAFFPKLTHAIICKDDAAADAFIAHAKQQSRNIQVYTYSIKDKHSDFYAQVLSQDLDVLTLKISTPKGAFECQSHLIGAFNIANLLAAIAAAICQNIDIEIIKNATKHLVGASGRMQRVPSKIGCFIVDYAHTPDALQKALQSLRALSPKRLWVVFGCGGDRDRTKRPIMAAIAQKLADRVIITSDNPRHESFKDILQDMQQGLKTHQNIIIESDRQKACDYAVAHAEDGDIVLVAGKGHETYQQIGDVFFDFDDVAVLKQAILRHQI